LQKHRWLYSRLLGLCGDRAVTRLNICQTSPFGTTAAQRRVAFLLLSLHILLPRRYRVWRSTRIREFSSRLFSTTCLRKRQLTLSLLNVGSNSIMPLDPNAFREEKGGDLKKVEIFLRSWRPDRGSSLSQVRESQAARFKPESQLEDIVTADHAWRKGACFR